MDKAYENGPEDGKHQASDYFQNPLFLVAMVIVLGVTVLGLVAANATLDAEHRYKAIERLAFLLFATMVGLVGLSVYRQHKDGSPRKLDDDAIDQLLTSEKFQKAVNEAVERRVRPEARQ